MEKEIFGNFAAGAGLFFIGIKLISENTKQMAGRGFHRLVDRFMTYPLLPRAFGLVAGALIQSTTAVTFILTSLISSRLITVRKAMPIITWSNIGNSLLVLLTVLDLQDAALYLVGAIGICFYFNLEKSNRFRDLIGALFGVGLLFLGLILIKISSAPLNEVEWFKHLLAYTRTSFLLVFFVSGFFTFIAQSSTTISVIAIALARDGLLGMDQTVMIIYGSNLGAGLSTYFMAADLKGTPRQLAIFQAIFKIIGTLILVPIFYIEFYFHIPAIQHFVTHLTSGFGEQMAFIYLIFQLVAGLVVSVLTTPIQRLLEKISPATPEEELGSTQFIYDQALEEPETALYLVEKEQLRLVRHLPEFLDAVREETALLSTPAAARLKEAVTNVSAKVTAFVTDLMDRRQSRDSAARSLNLQNRTEVILSIAETLDDFVSTILQSNPSEKLLVFSRQLAEALHLISITAYDAAKNPNEENRQTLLELTADRGEMMERIRRSFLSDEKNLKPANQHTLMAITTLFERAIWLVRRYGRLLS